MHSQAEPGNGRKGLSWFVVPFLGHWDFMGTALPSNPAVISLPNRSPCGNYLDVLQS